MLKQAFKRLSKKRQPQINGRLYLPSLQHPMTIRRDKWGIPYLHAVTRHDLFYGQGFVHAQDRLWQLELNRRAAKGTLSAVFGKITLETDRLSRTLGFGRLAETNWQTLSGQSRSDLLAYTAGVNAYLALNKPLPIEFSLIRHKPELWQPTDCLAYGRLQMWALTHGAMGEWIYAQVLETVGAEMGAELAMFYPDGNPVTLPDGIDVQALRGNLLKGTAANSFLGKGSLDGAGRGSNGWVIGPDRSSTGHPILCNDMHLPVGIPSLWHVQQLRSDDGFHAAGFTQPGLPYVMVGHNAHIAWGATLAYTDCEDLFVEKFHPDHSDLYQFGDLWRQAVCFTEHIPVRGSSDYVAMIKVTHHGPLVNDVLINSDTAQTEPTVALNSMALRPDVDFDGFGLLNTARGWDEFVTAVSHIQTPSLNFLYADTDDNIGHYVSGRVPVRGKGDGLTPAIGWSGEYEWINEIPFAEMPHTLNPSHDYIVSANNRITNHNYPHYLGSNWRNGYRAKRIQTLICSKQYVSPKDCGIFQLDCYHQVGLELIDQIRMITPKTDNSALSWRLLTDWDGFLTTDSVGGTVYQLFMTELTTAILGVHFKRPFLHHLLGLGPHPNMAPVNDFQGQWVVSLLHLLQTEQTMWLPRGAARDDLIDQCLAKTTQTMQAKYGNDPAEWEWGKLHRITFAHAMGIQPPLNKLFNLGPFAIGGDANTVAQTGIRPDAPFDNNAISISSRLIVDMSNLERTQLIHPPGQTGQVGTPHYDDMITAWLTGDFVTMAWGETAVNATTTHHLKLTPLH
jgi:penicillin G amidase